jgi:phosphoribosylamine--glycine ligase
LQVMERHSVPGLPMYRAFRTREGVEEYVNLDLEGEYVVKADGLCGGKGVKVGSCLMDTPC